MQLDAFTILFLGFLARATLGGLFLVLWLKGRRVPWFGWWCCTYLFAGLATAIFLHRGLRAEFYGVGLAVALLIVAFCCCWQGARVFEKRAPLWPALIALPGVWLAACAIPGFLSTVAYRVLLSSVLISLLMAMTAAEFWRGRNERLPSRWAVIILFASVALIFAVRIPLVGFAPFPFGALPEQANWLAIFNLIVFCHTILLAVLLVAMTRERQELEERTKAQTDPLTGALNRRAFMTRGRRLLLRHERKQEPLCLLFIDLDHFKSLNDRYGHSGGDDVLMRFVSVVHDSIRPTDFLFRLGGEEFCCLLPFTGTQGAQGVAERIRRKVEADTIDVVGIPVKVTVSIGIASTEAFGYDLDTLVRLADKAVYAAKRQGRNRVVVATLSSLMEMGGHPSMSGGDTFAAIV